MKRLLVSRLVHMLGEAVQEISSSSVDQLWVPLGQSTDA